MREFFDLANNPLFVKHLRSRLRRSAVLPGVVVVAFLSLLLVYWHSQLKIDDPDTNRMSHFFFWMQGFLLVLMGGSQVAQAVAQIKDTGMIDFHRITPIPPSVQTIGIMMGAPIRELILFAVTLPFALYVAIDGSVGVTNFCKLLLVQLGSALMYCSLAMIAGLAGGKARGASGRYVAILAGLNIMGTVFYEVGIYGPTLVTSMPVYHEVFFEDENAPAQKQMRQRRAQQQAQQQQFGGANPQPVERKRPPVTFYSAPLPLVIQSLLFQSCMLTFLFIGASRRMHSARVPLYRKPVALKFLMTLATLTLGSLWDAPTLFLTLGMAYFLTVCGVLLTNAATPPLGDVVKGLQRAHKLTGGRVPIWSDLASNKFIVFFFACVTGIAVSLGLLLAPQPPILGFMRVQHFFSPWPALLVAVLTLLTYGFASQYFALTFGKRARPMFVLFILLHWIAPIVIGFTLVRFRIEEGGYILAISPIFGIAFAGAFGIPEVNEMAIKIASIAPGAIATLAFLALLLNEEKKLRNEIADENAVRRRRKKDRISDYDEESEEVSRRD